MNKESEEAACRVTNRQTVNYLTSSNGTLWSKNEVVNSGSVYFLLQMQRCPANFLK
ncbi:hypothetical protein Tsp_05499 [Trichinella spiralis]|uniref:hypothetical protein n=1 Tax=Trichinella spiralis TaxID=6334 RepID=UPI0001EFDB8D|nr:hypothetical protein Tsp_05499 [Trichinella spiralis]